MEVKPLVKHCAIPQLPSPVTTALCPLKRNLLTGYKRVMVTSAPEHYNEMRSERERGWTEGKGYISVKNISIHLLCLKLHINILHTEF